jgi:hypothetical protein
MSRTGKKRRYKSFPALQVSAGHYIFQNRHSAEKLQILKGPGYSRFRSFKGLLSG